MIEIMISVLIMIVGLVGIFAMQIVAIQANASSRDVTEALGVAEHFIGTLEQDASNWTTGSALGNTTILTTITSNEGVWQLANGNQPVNVHGVAADPIARPAPGEEMGRFPYCVAYQLNWGVDNQVISGLVRVYWPRIGGQKLFGDDCGSTADLNKAIDGAPQVGVGVVTLPFAVRRTDVE